MQAAPGKTLKDAYHSHLKEALPRIAETNPWLSKKEVLKLAREECQPHIES